jgi:peroxiredoxin
MAQFEPFKDEIAGLGSLLFIAAQKRRGMIADPEKFLREHPAPAPFLLDEDRVVTKAYGVYKALGIDSVNIARPATFVIDKSGKISFLYLGSNQLDRASMDQVMFALRHAK